MSKELFDRSEEYDDMLRQGLWLSGEDKEYFIAGRLRVLDAHLPADFQPRCILDFGCGLGDTSAQLGRCFPEAQVLGIDTAAAAVQHATVHYGSEQIQFRLLDDFFPTGDIDLCYMSGVLHHIQPVERSRSLQLIQHALAPDGYFALFENNPWNLGTRLVMHRIPFDRDAIPLSPQQAKRLLREGGFVDLSTPQYLFYFPRPLALLRFAEPCLERVPLGAQYFILSRSTGLSNK